MDCILPLMDRTVILSVMAVKMTVITDILTARPDILSDAFRANLSRRLRNFSCVHPPIPPDFYDRRHGFEPCTSPLERPISRSAFAISPRRKRRSFPAVIGFIFWQTRKAAPAYDPEEELRIVKRRLPFTTRTSAGIVCTGHPVVGMEPVGWGFLPAVPGYFPPGAPVRRASRSRRLTYGRKVFAPAGDDPARPRRSARGEILFLRCFPGRSSDMAIMEAL